MSSPALQPFQALSNQKLSVQAKKMVHNVYAQVRKSDPQLSVRAACRKVSELTGVSERSVFRIKLDVNSGTLKSPKLKRLRLPAMNARAKTGRTRLELHDSFSLAALRRKVHQFFLRNEIPTAAKLVHDVTSDSDMNMPKMSVRTMQRLLNDIGFSFRKRKRHCALLERNDVVMWRRQYLRTIRQHRAQKRHIYYLDETWVNAGHTKDKVWEDANVTTREDAFRQGLTTGLRAPSGRGGRLILLHAGSEDGFLNAACLLFRATKRTGDYHAEMDGPRFEMWFTEQLLPNIKPHSVIVMDNAPYHSVRLEKVPTSSTRKADIQSWLTQKNIAFFQDQLKAELLDLVNDHKKMFSAYRVDVLGKAVGHDFVRLPPYHCEFNPIEMIWSQVKGYVAANNTSFTLAGVEKLVPESIALVTPDNWLRACNHVEKSEDEFWQRDGLIDAKLDQLIIPLGSDSSSESDDSDSNMSGMEYLR
ncbi:uncharacterized protein LOC119399462 [Rhipicephalus sanguineus]|uniref:uncharacterized protein LOC119399462 n=1 Tax=Rhipicephalus sanguineus TaxID=34632 RepID=UPI0020C1D61B|nr:uncharacterized protein LOC119399462 [Rhipicephalus sanguineus]